MHILNRGNLAIRLHSKAELTYHKDFIERQSQLGVPTPLEDGPDGVISLRDLRVEVTNGDTAIEHDLVRIGAERKYLVGDVLAGFHVVKGMLTPSPYL